MSTSISQPHAQTVKVDTDDEYAIIEIPSDMVITSVNPRGDSTFITIKAVATL